MWWEREWRTGGITRVEGVRQLCDTATIPKVSAEFNHFVGVDCEGILNVPTTTILVVDLLILICHHKEILEAHPYQGGIELWRHVLPLINDNIETLLIVIGLFDNAFDALPIEGSKASFLSV